MFSATFILNFGTETQTKLHSLTGLSLYIDHK